MLNVKLEKDSLIKETIQIVDSIHAYNKKNHQIEVINNNRVYGNTFVGTFNIVKIPTYLHNTITKSTINITENKDGSSIINRTQNNQKHQFIDSSKIKTPLYSEEYIYIYNYNSDDDLTLTDHTPVGYYSLNRAHAEGGIKKIKHKDLPFNTGEIKIRYASSYKNNIFLLDFIINKIDYQIIYTTNQQNQLLSFTYYKHSPTNYNIVELDAVAYLDTFQFIANAIIMCN